VGVRGARASSRERMRREKEKEMKEGENRKKHSWARGHGCAGHHRTRVPNLWKEFLAVPLVACGMPSVLGGGHGRVSLQGHLVPPLFDIL